MEIKTFTSTGLDMRNHGMGIVLALLLLVLTPVPQLDALPVVRQHDQRHQVVPAPLHLHPSLSLLYLAYPWNDARSIRSPFSSVGERAPEIMAQKRSWWPKRYFNYIETIFNAKYLPIQVCSWSRNLPLQQHGLQL